MLESVLTFLWPQTLILADNADGDLSSSCCGGGSCIGVMICPLIFAVLWMGIYLIWIIGMWKMFEKAGEPGWASIVPIYNIMILAKISGREPTEGLMVLIPIYGIYVAYLIYVDVAQAFGKDPGFAILMLLLPLVAFPMLGFGEARYAGAGRRKKKKMRRDIDEDEVDDEDRPRKARPRRDDDD